MTLRKLLFSPIPLLPRRVPRQSPAECIAASSLPPATQALLTDVVRKTRLKRHEKLAVAAELVSHFAEAAASGVSEADAIAAFGDPGVAAKLICRGKIRNRSWLWHSFRAVRWSAATLAVVYVGLGVYFFTGRPTVAVDYIERVNIESNARSADAAWPLYREAILGMPKSLIDPVELEGTTRQLVEVRPGEPEWDRLVATLGQAAPALERARQAAGRSAMGFVWGVGGSANDPELFPAQPGSPHVGGQGDEMIAVLLPNVSEMRRLATALVADGRWAASQKDASRFVSDIEALLGMARHLTAKPSPLVYNLVGIGITDLALRELDQVLRTAPEWLSDRDLARIAHLLAGPKVAADLLDLTVERYFFYDMVQRTFTDDGNGDGRLTPAGIERLNRLGGSLYSARDDKGSNGMVYAVSGAAPVFFAGRRETLALYDRIMDLTEANYRVPSHRADWSAVDRLIEEVKGSLPNMARYPVLQMMLPSLSRAQLSAERVLASRDAIQIAVACELFRRKTGGNPKKLQDLVPDLLPSLPMDPVNGQPLLLADRDGKPVIYSRGSDGDDDHGTPPTAQSPGSPRRQAHAWDPDARNPMDGDWILFPRSESR
jgi:hypothetical protein